MRISDWSSDVCPSDLFGFTRPMNDSPTSTSITSESMSTTVPMPVRVKPPPADSGDTISPGCAALAVTTPANGARTMVLRSEEHTSELQSLMRISYAVFCLKKKKHTKPHNLTPE